MLTKPGLFKRGNESSAGSPAVTHTSNAPGSPGSVATPRPSPAINNQAAASQSPAMQNSTASPESKAVVVEKEKPAPLSGSRLIVGPDVKLKGAEILDCDTLVVEGRVEAVMDSRVIQIAAEGAFSGKVGVDIAEVFGQFDGELTARSQLIIHSTGRVSGKIRYGKILIEEGGEVSGDTAAIASEHPQATRLSITANSSVEVS